MALRDQIWTELEVERSLHLPLSGEQTRLEEQLKTEPEGEQRTALENREKDARKLAAASLRKITQLGADLKTLDDPSAPPHAFHQILARQQAGGTSRPALAADIQDDSPWKRWWQDAVLRFDRAIPRSTYADNLATRETAERSITTGPASGYSRMDTDTRETVRKDGRTAFGWTRKDSVSLLDGVSHESGRTVEEEQDGQKRVWGDKTVTSVGLGNASRTATRTETRADSSSEVTTDVKALERGEGKAGVKDVHAEVRKDAAGTMMTTTTTGKAGLVAGNEGLGVYGEREKAADRATAKGLKTGVVVGLSGNIVLNVEQVPDKSPPQYVLVLSVNLGGKLGLSGGRDPDATAEKPSERAAVKGYAKLSGEGSVVMTERKVLGEDEARAYIERVKAANGGNASGPDRELAIIAVGKNRGWESARALYQGARSGAADASTLADMKDGDSFEFKKEGKVGLDVGGSAGEGVGSLGVDLGYGRGSSSTVSVEKKDGKFIFKPTEGSSARWTAGGSAGFGGVKGGASISKASTSSTGYSFTLDPKDPLFPRMRDELNACRNQEDLDAFARKYPQAIGEKTKTHGEADMQSFTLGVGTSSSLGLNYGSSFEESTTTDAEGKAKGSSATGTNSGGAELKIGGYSVGASSKESATSQADASGKATVDVNRTDKATDLIKFLEAHAPLSGAPKQRGYLGALSGAKVDTDTQHVTGIKLGDAELDYFGSLAQDLEGWMRACPSPRLNEDWRAARHAVLAAAGDHARIGRAIARFVGKGGHGRDAVLHEVLRADGSRGGAAYEFPEALISQKPKYDALVIGDPVDALTSLEQKEGPEKAKVQAQEVVRQLDFLYSAVMSSTKFESAGTQAEMLAAIGKRRGEVDAKVRSLNGGKLEAPSPQVHVERYNVLITNCTQHRFAESGLFDKIEKLYTVDAIAFSHSLDELPLSREVERGDLVKQLSDLYAIWDKEYDEMASLAQEHGFGKDTYWRYKPDKVRFARAKTQRPGQASEAKPESEDKRRKQQDQPRRALSSKEDEARQQAEHANSAAARIRPSKNKAYGSGNRLFAWIQKDRKPGAIDAHNRGMVRLHEGDGWGSKLGKTPSEYDWTTYGTNAVDAYNEAAEAFQEGLGLYPPGWPPKET